MALFKYTTRILRGVSLQVLLVIIVSLIILSDGFYSGWRTAKVSELTTNEKLPLSNTTILGTLPLYVTPVVLPISIYSSNKIGRKYTILWGGSLTLMSWLCFYFSGDNIVLIYAGSVIRGFSIFIIYTTSVIYIAEVSEDRIRGLLCGFVPIFLNIGITSSYICNLFNSMQYLPLCGITTILLFILSFVFAPLTPYFLYMNRKPDESKQCLERLRSKNYPKLEEEFLNIKVVVDRNINDQATIKQFLLDPVNKKISLIVFVVQMIQEFSGIDTIMLFLEVILKSSHSNLNSELSTLIFGIVKLLNCVVAMIIVDKVGRKPLLIFSCALSTLSLLFLGLYFYTQEISNSKIFNWDWSLLVILLIYISGYNIGLGTVPFILGSEMYPTKYKAYGTSVSQIVYAISNIIVTHIFAWLKDSFGFYAAFWFLALFTFFGLIFCLVFVIETKEQSLKDILNILET